MVSFQNIMANLFAVWKASISRTRANNPPDFTKVTLPRWASAHFII